MPVVRKKRQSGQKATTKPQKGSGRSVVHSKVSCEICAGKSAITGEKAKELLGYQEEADDANGFGPDYLLVIGGKKVRCDNNTANRPVYTPNLLKLKQEILRGRWSFNGEPIIIGTTGLILNGQHTLLALLMAIAEWTDDSSKWPHWSVEPTVDKMIVYGVDESRKTVDTMDTCKPRSLMDVIFSAGYFDGLSKSAERQACKITEYAVKMLWFRTGVHANAFAVKQTHSESIAFLEAHKRLIEAVRHIYEENDTTNKIGKFISPGYAAAAMYLMATSGSDPEAYYTDDNPREELLDFDRWDKASEFFVKMAAGAEEFKHFRKYIAELLADGNLNHTEKWAIVVKAWNQYVNGKPITTSSITLEFEITEDSRQLADHPLLGGIDVGDDGLAFIGAGDPTPDEIETAVKKIRKELTAKRAGSTWAKGDVAWVHPSGKSKDDPYLGTLAGDPFPCDDNVERVWVDAVDGNWEVATIQLSLSRHNTK